MLRALGSAWRGALEGISFSSTRLRHATGAHLHRIDHYPKVAVMYYPGQRIESAPFVVGGYQWRLHFYPNGTDDSEFSGRAAVNVILRCHGSWWRPPFDVAHATAAYEVSVLDDSGNRVVGRAVGPRSCFSWLDDDAKDVATAEELRLAAMRGGKDGGGGIVLRCDLTVMSLEKESRVKWCLRQLVSKLS